ncbi:hypothetical protein HN014_22330 (plasmid) [Aquimarina sp. TRL1]|uniref:hypothetical protein n=1 Tax=Aquimarina sp. (strain TRL1) TaxID=2736252 RepID=UPI00158BF236|nr:hypothetical protein [Aquimarina sp. TRL1]QKX07740.1 hypothetical protein HN014_22330 [Aquimarina sp. TRL1]
MGQVIYEIRKDNRCYFKITSYPPEERYSSYICLNWSGFVDQFRKEVSIEEIKQTAIKWLENKIEKGFDNQYSDKKSVEWLLNKLKNSNQLELFKA